MRGRFSVASVPSVPLWFPVPKPTDHQPPLSEHGSSALRYDASRRPNAPPHDLKSW